MSLHVHLAPGVTGAAVGASVRVDGDEGHHAVAVRRLRVGERLVLTDGVGTRATCVVGDVARGQFTAVVEDIETTVPPSPELIVVQALPKGTRGELAVEMLTEIGVSRIVPWAASRSVTQWREDRGGKALTKWRTTAREAAKQARRDWFPVVDPLADTAGVRRLIGAADVAVTLHEQGGERLSSVVSGPMSSGSVGAILLIVGPEGGLSDEELAAFEESGARTVRLGSEVLRTSTAGVAAAAAILSGTPRWG
jgi:16S rRNA (uracil1498-N3)-methyltransferase